MGAAFARIWVATKDGRFLELHASAGMYTRLDGAHRLVPVGHLKIGLIAQERTPHITNDVINDPRLSDRDWARVEGMVAFAGFPLLAGNQVVGVLAMFSREPISQARHGNAWNDIRHDRAGYPAKAGGGRSPSKRSISQLRRKH